MVKVLKKQMTAAQRGSIMRVECVHAIDELNNLLYACGPYINDTAKAQIESLKKTLTNPSALIDDINVESYRVGEKSVKEMPTYKLCRVRINDCVDVASNKSVLFTPAASPYYRYRETHCNILHKTDNLIVYESKTASPFIHDGLFNIGYSDGTNFHCIDTEIPFINKLGEYILEGNYDIPGASKEEVEKYLKEEIKTTFDNEYERATINFNICEDMYNYMLLNNIYFYEAPYKPENSIWRGKKVDYSNPIEAMYYTSKYFVYETAEIPLDEIDSYKNKITEKSSFIQKNMPIWEYMNKIHQ